MSDNNRWWASHPALSSLHPSHRRRLEKLVRTAEDIDYGRVIQHRSIDDVATEIDEPRSSLARTLTVLVDAGVLLRDRGVRVGRNGGCLNGRSTYYLAAFTESNPHEIPCESPLEESMRFRAVATHPTDEIPWAPGPATACISSNNFSVTEEGSSSNSIQSSGTADAEASELIKTYELRFKAECRRHLKTLIRQKWVEDPAGVGRLLGDVATRPGVVQPWGLVKRMLEAEEHRSSLPARPCIEDGEHHVEIVSHEHHGDGWWVEPAGFSPVQCPSLSMVVPGGKATITVANGRATKVIWDGFEDVAATEDLGNENGLLAKPSGWIERAQSEIEW